MSSSYRIELDNWLRSLDVDAKNVLDIGGSQLPIKGRTRTWNAKSYLIGDLEEPHIGSPKPDLIMDLNKEVFLQSSKIGAFDLIFCLEVFDYIWNPAGAFKNIEWLLHKDGQAWVTFPFAYPTHQPIEDDALRYTEGGIKKLAAYAGLEIEELIRRRPETNALTNFYSIERMRAAKNYDHNFTGWIVRFKKKAK